MATYIQIGSTVEVGAGGQASIEFTAIPGTYTDLQIVYSLRSNRSSGAVNDSALIRFNGSTSAQYSARSLLGNGSTASSFSLSNDAIGIYNYFATTTDLATSNTFSNGSVYIPNYAGSTNKSLSIDNVTENNATNAIAGFIAGLWANTAAITSINLRPEYGTLFKQYSTATLYGISKS